MLRQKIEKDLKQAQEKPLAEKRLTAQKLGLAGAAATWRGRPNPPACGQEMGVFVGVKTMGRPSWDAGQGC